METEKILLTGTLEALPQPFLTPERTISCRLTVRPRQVCHVGAGIFSKDETNYTVEVSSSVQHVIYKAAQVHDAVLVCGYRTKDRMIKQARVFKKQAI